MKSYVTFQILGMILLVGCGSAPTPTASPTPSETPAPTSTVASTAAPTATPPPPPTITVNPPSNSGGSTLQAYIAAADETLCEGSVPREFALYSQRSDDLPVQIACLKRLREREGPAGEQQQALHTRGTCLVQPGSSDEAQRQIRAVEIWALDDLAMGYLLAAEGLLAAEETALAREAYETVMDHYTCGWVYELETGVYASAKEAAETALAALDE